MAAAAERPASTSHDQRFAHMAARDHAERRNSLRGQVARLPHGSPYDSEKLSAKPHKGFGEDMTLEATVAAAQEADAGAVVAAQA